LPSAREMPRIEMFHLTTPSPINPQAVKGAGEAGTLLGARESHAGPARISHLIHGA